MKIKDIVNRDLVNLDNCENEPIHIPGSIQPHGFLIAVKISDGVIDFCSANTAEYIGMAHNELLGISFEKVFENVIPETPTLHPVRMTFNGMPFHCTIHHSATHYTIEGEPIIENETYEQSEFYDQTARFLSYMHETHTLKQLCQLVAEGTKQITGYDRVMIYRFDKDYNGEVFAESCNSDLEPFLGLHYPHTDIPVQARKLYMQNLIRLIADITYTAVPIYTIDDSTDKNLDLSLSILRSTSPIHIQYLQNMGVSATLTISLIHQGRLWGLIACHHYSPKNLSPQIRLAAQLQGHFITSQIDVRQSNEEYIVARKTIQAFEKLTAIRYNNANFFENLIQSQDLLDICNASGVSIMFNGIIYKSGLTPVDEEIKELSATLSKSTSCTTLVTDRLALLFPDSAKICGAISGAIYHCLGPDDANSIIWYRPENITEVDWAGDPGKAILKDEKGLSPRNSFELWKETVKCQSKPWLEPEIESAANYAHALEKQMSLILLTDEEKRNRELNEILKENNSELENINWISTHDLQEPLRKIQLISSRLLNKEDEIISPAVFESLTRMNNSAGRMQRLLTDILRYTKIKHTEGNFEMVDPTTVLQEVVNDTGELIAEKSAVISIGLLPVLLANPFLLAQLFLNLLNNSLKYSRNGIAPVITVTGQEGVNKPDQSPDDNRLFNMIRFEDNGIGFDDTYKESIFNIFKRLHSQEEFNGSGVGLALCKKIMQNHHGVIVASGKPNQGATFTLYFPISGQENSDSVRAN